MRGIGRDAACADRVRGEQLAEQRAAGVGIGNRVSRLHGAVDGGLDAVLHPVPLVGHSVLGHVEAADRGGDGIADAWVLVVDGNGCLQLRINVAVRQRPREVRLAAELCGGVGRHLPAPGCLHALAGLDALADGVAGPAGQLVGGGASRHIRRNGSRVPQRRVRDGRVAGTVDEDMDLACCLDVRSRVGVCLPGRSQDACRNGDDGDCDCRRHPPEDASRCGCKGAHRASSSLLFASLRQDRAASPPAIRAAPARPAIGRASPVLTAPETASIALDAALLAPLTVT